MKKLSILFILSTLAGCSSIKGLAAHKDKAEVLVDKYKEKCTNNSEDQKRKDVKDYFTCLVE